MWASDALAPGGYSVNGRTPPARSEESTLFANESADLRHLSLLHASAIGGSLAEGVKGRVQGSPHNDALTADAPGQRAVLPAGDLPATLFERMLTLASDTGSRGIVAANTGVIEVPIPSAS